MAERTIDSMSFFITEADLREYLRPLASLGGWHITWAKQEYRFPMDTGEPGVTGIQIRFEKAAPK
jgi:hypothetical protein